MKPQEPEIVRCSFQELEQHAENLIAFGVFGTYEDGRLAFAKDMPYDLSQIVFPEVQQVAEQEPERVWKVIERILNYCTNDIGEDYDKARLLRQILLLDCNARARSVLLGYAWVNNRYLELATAMRWDASEIVRYYLALRTALGANNEIGEVPMLTLKREQLGS